MVKLVYGTVAPTTVEDSGHLSPDERDFLHSFSLRGHSLWSFLVMMSLDHQQKKTAHSLRWHAPPSLTCNDAGMSLQQTPSGRSIEPAFSPNPSLASEPSSLSLSRQGAAEAIVDSRVPLMVLLMPSPLPPQLPLIVFMQILVPLDDF